MLHDARERINIKRRWEVNLQGRKKKNTVKANGNLTRQKMASRSPFFTVQCRIMSDSSLMSEFHRKPLSFDS